MKCSADNPHDERNTRHCRKCGEVKSVAEFPWDKRSKYGCYEARCYECKRRANHEHYLHVVRFVRQGVSPPNGWPATSKKTKLPPPIQSQPQAVPMTTQARSKIVHLYGEIREMWGKGMSAGLITDQLKKQHSDLNITRNMIIRATRTMNLQRRPSTKVIPNRINTLRRNRQKAARP